MGWVEQVKNSADSLLARFQSGDVRALSRLLTLVENRHPASARLLARLDHPARACRVGITGAPGVGKSTLLSRLAGRMAAGELSVAVLAVDPTSPFTGGALLGDRTRFQPPAGRTGARPPFFRSLASRGHNGGLTRSAETMCLLLEAFGYQRLLVESVGMGQLGTDVAEVCDTVVVVMVPESGDQIQALKAGLMEIAHVLVVNKADRPGAQAMRAELEEALRARRRDDDWRVPVLLTCALEEQGLADLEAQIERHRQFRAASGRASGPEEQRLRRTLVNLVREQLWEALAEGFRQGRLPDGRPLDPALRAMMRGKTTPLQVAREAVESLLAGRREQS